MRASAPRNLDYAFHTDDGLRDLSSHPALPPVPPRLTRVSPPLFARPDNRSSSVSFKLSSGCTAPTRSSTLAPGGAGRGGTGRGDISSIKYRRRIAEPRAALRLPRVRVVCVAFSNAVTAVASHFSSRLFVRLSFWELVPGRSRAVRLIYRDRYWHAGEHNCTREERREGRCSPIKADSRFALIIYISD